MGRLIGGPGMEKGVAKIDRLKMGSGDEKDHQGDKVQPADGGILHHQRNLSPIWKNRQLWSRRGSHPRHCGGGQTTQLWTSAMEDLQAVDLDLDLDLQAVEATLIYVAVKEMSMSE